MYLRANEADVLSLAATAVDLALLVPLPEGIAVSIVRYRVWTYGVICKLMFESYFPIGASIHIVRYEVQIFYYALLLLFKNNYHCKAGKE